MIRRTYWPNPFDAAGMTRCELPHRTGMRVRDALPAHLTALEHVVVVVDGRPAELDGELADGSHVACAPRPADPLSVSLTAGAAAGGSFSFFGLTGAAAYWLMAASIGGLSLLSKLLAPPKPGKRRGDDESNAYGYSGQGNVRQEGQPIGMPYGRFRQGGTVVNEYIVARQNPPETEYRALLALGEGPVQSIAGLDVDTPVDDVIVTGDANFPRGIQVNGIDASDLTGIEVSVRLGSNEQEPIPGFESINQLVPIDATLESVKTTAAANNTFVFDASNFTTSTADDQFTAYGKGFDLTQDYDAFTVTTAFLAGLWSVSGSGASQNAYFQCAIRYIEIDAAGDPIATGGPEGDGYVRLPPEAIVKNSTRRPFGVGFRHTLYDPQTYTHGAVARACTFAAGSSAAKSSPTFVNWVAGAAITSFTLNFWVKFTTVSGDYRVWTWSSVGAGFTVDALFATGDSAGPFGIQVTLTTGPATFNSKVVPQADTWTMVTVTYGQNVSGSSDRLRIYVDGVLTSSTTFAYNVLVPSAATAFRFGDPGGSTGFIGDLDEAILTEGEWTPAEVAARYNAGSGQYEGTSSVDVGLWHFDTTSVVNAADSSGNSNTLTYAGSAAVGSAANGIVQAPPGTGTPKRSRYRVEVVRVNHDSINAFTSDEATWQYLTGHIDEALSYPNMALLGISIKSQEQVSGSIPTITTVGDWRLCPLWDGLSTTSPQFNDGWSRNPAAVGLDLILRARTGLGQFYGGQDVDIEAWQGLFDYAGELIYDHKGRLAATGDWTDLTYTGSGGVGTILIEFTSAAYTSLKWKVGDYLGFDGVPQVSSNPEINNPAPGGWLISASDPVNFTLTVDVALSADPWTSGTALSSHVTVDGEIEGREPRYCYDGVFDTDRSAWDALLQILSTARAVPVRVGKKITVKWERPRSPVDIVGMGNILAGSFEVEYGNRADRANSIAFDIWSEDRNYTNTPDSLDHPAVQNASSLETLRREQIGLEGVCRPSQARRNVAFMLNVNNDLVRDGVFRASVDALPYQVGDVVVLGHDVTQWGESGRLYAAVDDDSVQLDRQVTLAGATTYVLYVRNSATGQWESQTVSSAAATYDIGDAIDVGSAFSFTPQRDDPYILVVEGEEHLAQITGLRLLPDLTREVRWLEYVEGVYDDDWFDDVTGGP